jgi:hypothetical protein
VVWSDRWGRPVSRLGLANVVDPGAGPLGRGVLHRPGRCDPAPVRGVTRLPVRGASGRGGGCPVRVHHGGVALGGARLPRRTAAVLHAHPAGSEDGSGQGRGPGAGPGVTGGRALDRRDLRGVDRRRYPAQPHRGRRDLRAGGPAPAVAPPRRAARRTTTSHPAPRRGPGLGRRPGTRPVPGRGSAADHPGPGRAGPARHGRRRRLPRHLGGPGNQLPAVPAGAQADRQTPRVARRRPGHRPGRSSVRRTAHPAQDRRTDQLLLPPAAQHPDRVPGRPGHRRTGCRAGHRRRAQPRLPRRHALGRRPGTGTPLRAPPLPTHPQRADLLRRGRHHPHPALRQRRPVQSHPEQRDHRVLRPLAHPHRTRPAPCWSSTPSSPPNTNYPFWTPVACDG